MQEFSNIKLKLFVRRDLFRRIIAGGFVNLTHVNARKIEIEWEDDDLLSLLRKRVLENSEFIEAVGLSKEASAEEVFAVLFPAKVDAGSRRPTTWTWMILRIRDGNNVKPPRNLIDLAVRAREAQLRREDRKPETFNKDAPLISSDALKYGLEALSGQRVEDTLLAEAGENSVVIELFRNGKAEHNSDSLRHALGKEDYDDSLKYLVAIGFLEKVGGTYKIPALYRGGLNITQGKAFLVSDPDSSDIEDEEHE